MAVSRAITSTKKLSQMEAKVHKFLSLYDNYQLFLMILRSPGRGRLARTRSAGAGNPAVRPGVSISPRLVRRTGRAERNGPSRPPARVRSKVMRVMVMVKATKNSEAGALPSQELIEAMGRFNAELIKAGVMLAGDGLKPSKLGKRVRFTGTGGKKTIVDGPFAETKELVAGYWIWQVKSLDEAIAWLRRCPDPMPGEESEIEIRPLYEAEDFAPAAQ